MTVFPAILSVCFVQPPDEERLLLLLLTDERLEQTKLSWRFCSPTPALYDDDDC